MKFYTHVTVSGDNILHSGYENGSRVRFRVPFRPTIFVTSNKQNTQYKTIHSECVESFQPGTIKETKEFVKNYQHVSNFKIYGNTSSVYQYITSLYPNHEHADFDINTIKVLYVDIETQSEAGFPSIDTANEQINVITLRLNDYRWVFGVGEFDMKEDSHTKVFKYSDDKELLMDFIKIWQDIDPDVITGWFVRTFDIPYIVNRIKNLLGIDYARKLSPWKQVHEDEVEIKGQLKKVYNIVGVSILDYYELYRKYTGHQLESYKLDYVASEELGKKKVVFTEYDNIKDFYTKNFQKFVEYNITDVDLVHELDEKLNLIRLQISQAYIAKENYEDVYSQVKTWDNIITNHLIARNIVVPQKETKDKPDQYIGAYVKDPITGMHDWVVSLDLASLYPHLIMQFNISPDTIVDENIKVSLDDLLACKVDNTIAKTKNYAMAANGQFFRRDKQGFLSELMEKFYENRKASKKKMIEYKKQAEKETDPIKIKELKKQASIYDTAQNAYKIQLNSAYGAVGNNYFRFYDIRQAEAVTVSGQLAIRWIHDKLNEYLNKILETNNKDYIIAVDTDSVYLNMSSLVDKIFQDKSDKTKIVDFLDKVFKEKLQPFINKQYETLADYTNAYQQKMEMKREVIADRGVWTAKKRYCLHVHDTEGVRHTTPKLKIMGIEVQRSTTPAICRAGLKESIKIILTKDQKTLIDHIAKCKKEFMESPPEAIAFPKGVHGISEYVDPTGLFKKSTPMHTKGAIIYNDLLKRFNLQTKYEKIVDGEKIKYLYLKIPNITRCHVVSFMNKFPKEFGLNDFIDYETQFQKSFLDPLNIILDAIKWSHEDRADLGEFFEF